MITNIIAHLLLNEAVNAYSRKKMQKRMAQMTTEVEQYYMTFFGEIFLTDERNWILNNKIKPMFSKMDDKALADIIKKQKKNNKLIKQDRPIKYILVDKETIAEYHLEYHNLKQEEERQRRDAIERRKREIENEKLHKEYIFEFGESNAEIARKFFN